MTGAGKAVMHYAVAAAETRAGNFPAAPDWRVAALRRFSPADSVTAGAGDSFRGSAPAAAGGHQAASATRNYVPEPHEGYLARISFRWETRRSESSRSRWKTLRPKMKPVAPAS